jgi:hypothetical protein
MGQSDLLIVELSLKIISFSEFIADVVGHLGNFVLGLLHFLAYSEFKTLYFLQILVDVLFLYLKLGSCTG